MKIVGYRDEYRSGIVDCLKRNYQSMSGKSNDELSTWIDPIVNYQWAHKFPIELYPYKFGMVLLNDQDSVVGYLGLIYSKQLINNEYKTVVNPTTWAIDSEYRAETFKCIYNVQQTADIVLDYTARKSLVEIFTKMFGFKNIDETGCFFLPKPCFKNSGIKVKRLHSGDQIDNEYIREVFDDHKPYGIRCFEVSRRNKKEYLFYKIIKRATVLKGVLPLSGINVLYTSDNTFFGEYAKEIIWKMQRIERAALKTDSRYFNIDVGRWNKVRTYPINRLVSGVDNSADSIGAVYTELSILLNE